MSAASNDHDTSVVTDAITPKGLRISGLRKVFGEKVVVADLDLDVQPGELVSLLGPSGCGKTTTLRMVAGFLEADGGRIEIDGADIIRLPPDRRPSAICRRTSRRDCRCGAGRRPWRSKCRRTSPGRRSP